MIDHRLSRVKRANSCLRACLRSRGTVPISPWAWIGWRSSRSLPREKTRRNGDRPPLRRGRWLAGADDQLNRVFLLDGLARQRRCGRPNELRRISVPRSQRHGPLRSQAVCGPMLAGLAFLAVLLNGCSMLQGLRPNDRGNRASVPDTLPPEVKAKHATDDTAAMAAVEEFLRRTEEYSLSGSSTASPHASPPPPLAAPPLEGVSAKDSQNGVREGDMRETIHTQSVPHQSVLANSQVALDSDSVSGRPLALPVIQSLSVVDPKRVVPESHGDEGLRTTNQPLDIGTAPSPDLVDQLFAVLQGGDTDTRKFDDQWRLTLMALAFDRDVPPVNEAAGLRPESVALLSPLIRLAREVRRVAHNPSEVSFAALEHLDALRRLLVRNADPVVTTVALCRRVVTFGVYDELAKSDILAGGPLPMIVYTEIENLVPETADDGYSITRLATRLEVLTADGQSVWAHQEPEIVDRCRQPRRDFFVAQRVTLPPTLSAGDYVLKVWVEDKTSGRAGETTHPFWIESPMSVANRG